MNKQYLITGGSGAIGSSIVPLLLDEVDTMIYLIIRANSPEHLNQRLQILYEFWGIQNDSVKIARINPIIGDLDKKHFGVAEIIYNEMISGTTHIIHCAGNVRMNLKMAEAIKESAGVTKAILAYANECVQLKKIEFISTIGVAGKMPDNITEKRLIHNYGFHNNYEAAKYQAELMLWDEISNGMPITIHRPSMVVGNSENGKILSFQIFYFLMEFLKAKKTFGILPDFKKHQLDIVPIDFVAKAIVLSSNDLNSIGRVFHLCSGLKSAPLKMLLRESNKELIKKPRLVSVSLFKNTMKIISLFMNKNDRKKIKTLPFFLAYLEREQVFQNKESLKYFSSKGLTLQSYEYYLSNLMSFFNLSQNN